MNRRLCIALLHVGYWLRFTANRFRRSNTTNSNDSPRYFPSQEHILPLKECAKMPNVLSKWIDKKLSRPKSDETPEQLPFLPQHRPRVLTPSPSRESLVLSAEAATSNSAFFQKLPSEIRRKILKEAFGMFAMHMHLSLEYPRIPIKDRTPQDSGRHARISYIPNTWEAQKPPKRFGIPKQKTWQWFGCICHRSWPWHLSQWQPYWMGGSTPDFDRCIAGSTCDCKEWPGEAPGKCFIGAMGWLLSCRQALVLIFQSFKVISYAG